MVSVQQQTLDHGVLGLSMDLPELANGTSANIQRFGKKSNGPCNLTQPSTLELQYVYSPYHSLVIS